MGWGLLSPFFVELQQFYRSPFTFSRKPENTQGEVMYKMCKLSVEIHWVAVRQPFKSIMLYSTFVAVPLLPLMRIFWIMSMYIYMDGVLLIVIVFILNLIQGRGFPITGMKPDQPWQLLISTCIVTLHSFWVNVIFFNDVPGSIIDIFPLMSQGV